MPRKAGVDELLHLAPHGKKGRRRVAEARVVWRWKRRAFGQEERPVHEIQINVRSAQIRERLGERARNLVRVRFCRPQLARYEQVFPTHDASLDDVCESSPDLSLVSICSGTVDVPVPRLNGSNDGCANRSGLALPRPEADLWHLGTSK